MGARIYGPSLSSIESGMRLIQLSVADQEADYSWLTAQPEAIFFSNRFVAEFQGQRADGFLSEHGAF
jgi:hypothetical protein